MTFWERVESALIENRINEAELSRRIGLNQSSITSWKLRGSMPRADLACKTAEILNTTVEYLINGESVDLSKTKQNGFLVPVLNQDLSAGNGSLLPETDTASAFLELPTYFKTFGDKLACLYVHGDSMEPTLKNGSLVILNPVGYDNGEGLYGIRLNGNGYVKRLQVAAGKLLIISDNPKYRTIEEPIDSQNLEVIGKVVGTLEYNYKGL